MNRILFGLLCIVVFNACSKKDDGNSQPPPGSEVRCTAAQQSGIESSIGRDTLDEITDGANFKKTYGADGKVMRLELLIEATAKRREILDYHFTYEGSMSHVSRKWELYRPDANGVLQLIVTDNSNYNVVFNSDGYATQSGRIKYEYSNGKLVSGGDVDNILHYAFEYDGGGNVIKIKQFTSYGYRSLTYDYDYSRQAKHQIYLTDAS